MFVFVCVCVCVDVDVMKINESSCPFICPSIHVSVCLSISLFICPFDFLFFHLSVYPSVYLFACFNLSILTTKILKKFSLGSALALTITGLFVIEEYSCNDEKGKKIRSLNAPDLKNDILTFILFYSSSSLALVILFCFRQ